MSEYRILFLGDIVGKPGRRTVRDGLPSLCDQHLPLFVVANAENAAGGVGITPEIAEELLGCGIDALTLGNHAFQKKEVYGYLDTDRPVARPANMPPGVPGRGVVRIVKEGIELAVVNLCGRVFLDGYDDPFREADRILAELTTPHVLVDFHAEATSEKAAFAWHVDGRVSAVLGTHTHVTTADERVLPKGTATITDVGMTGPVDSVIGMDKGIILRRFLTSLPAKFEVADARGVISGVVVSVERDTGLSTGIRRVSFGEPL
jgi:hypothetical protein